MRVQTRTTTHYPRVRSRAPALRISEELRGEGHKQMHTLEQCAQLFRDTENTRLRHELRNTKAVLKDLTTAFQSEFLHVILQLVRCHQHQGYVAVDVLIGYLNDFGDVAYLFDESGNIVDQQFVIQPLQMLGYDVIESLEDDIVEPLTVYWGAPCTREEYERICPPLRRGLGVIHRRTR